MFEGVTERSQAAEKSRQKLRFVRRANPQLD
jgi:hypothetical protein